MGSIVLTREDIANLELEIGVWCELVFDGATIEVYRDGKFIKRMAVERLVERAISPEETSIY